VSDVGELLAMAGERTITFTPTEQESRYAKAYRTDVDYPSRQVWLGDIEAETGDWFRHILWAMEDSKPGTPITVWLNTPGGHVPSMFQIYDCIVGSPSEITVIGHGEVISAGVLIFVAGHKRLVTDNCVFMSHEGADFEASGLNYSEMKERKKYWDWTMSRWNELMERHTPYNAAHWKSVTSKKAEFWLLGGQAIVDYGIADGLYDPHGRLSKFAPATPVEEEAE
jgi:ATP-dependent protease ClpP protease subunit